MIIRTNLIVTYTTYINFTLIPRKQEKKEKENRMAKRVHIGSCSILQTLKPISTRELLKTLELFIVSLGRTRD